MSAVEQAPQRTGAERQLGIGLVVVMVLAVLIALYGVLYIVSYWDGQSDLSRFDALRIGIVFLLLPGIVVFFAARAARRRLKIQVVSAKLYSILTGVFAIIAGLPILATLFGLLSVVAGLFTLVCALLLKKDRLS
jgi:hypothetical protein